MRLDSDHGLPEFSDLRSTDLRSQMSDDGSTVPRIDVAERGGFGPKCGADINMGQMEHETGARQGPWLYTVSGTGTGAPGHASLGHPTPGTPCPPRPASR